MPLFEGWFIALSVLLLTLSQVRRMSLFGTEVVTENAEVDLDGVVDLWREGDFDK